MTVEKRKANRGPYDYIPRARHFSPSNSLGTFPNPFGKPIFEKEQKSPLSNPFLLNKSSDPFSQPLVIATLIPLMSGHQFCLPFRDARPAFNFSDR